MNLKIGRAFLILIKGLTVEKICQVSALLLKHSSSLEF